MEALRQLTASRELIFVLARREISARYKYTILGAGWAVALPVCLMLVFTFVFSRVAPVATGGIPYPVFAYIGLLPWQLHANMLATSARSLTDNPNLVTKVYFAREALPLSRVCSALFDFTVACAVLVGLMAWYGIAPGPGIWFVPLVLALQVMLGIGLAFWASAANLVYRDVQYLLQLVIPVWMFSSSVVYPVPAQGALRWLNLLNPMTQFLDAYRALIVGRAPVSLVGLSVAAGISVLVLISGWAWFRRKERDFGELA